MKKYIYYPLSGILVGIGIDMPILYLFGICGLGGAVVCYTISLVALWVFPILGGLIGFHIARKSNKNLSLDGSVNSGNTLSNNGHLKKVLFLSTLPIIIFLLIYIFYGIYAQNVRDSRNIEILPPQIPNVPNN
ncbi:MAG: hypothetical protein ACI8V7_000493 [Candidatus Paceibacteria bacterium]|jgi:uncharacterized protein YneF (UPF0154 family)